MAYTVKRTGNDLFDRNLDDIARELKGLAFIPKSPLLEDVALTTAGKTVAHGLGRVPLGWFVVRKNANAVVWETQAPDKDNIYLDASATVTVTLLVF